MKMLLNLEDITFIYSSGGPYKHENIKVVPHHKDSNPTAYKDDILELIKFLKLLEIERENETKKKP